MSAKDLKCPKCGQKVYSADPVCFSCGEDLRVKQRQASEPAATPPPPGPRQPVRPVAPAGPLPDMGPTAHPPPPPGPGYATSARHSAVGPGRVPVGGGFFDKLARGWEFMKQSLVMWRENPGLIVPSVISLFSLLAFYVVVYLALVQFGLWERLMSDEGEGGIVEYAIGIPVLLLAYMITYFFVGMTIHLVDAHLRGETASLGAAYADSLKNMPAMALLAVLSTVVSLIASKVREKGGFFTRTAANVGEAAWHAATYLVLPVIICEDVPLKQAMKRAHALHKSHFSDLLIAEFGVRLVSQVIGFVAVFVAVGQGVLLVSLGGTALLIVGIVIGVIVISVAMVFTTYLRTAYYTCLYLWAAALEEATVPVPAPAPLAYAFA